MENEKTTNTFKFIYSPDKFLWTLPEDASVVPTDAAEFDKILIEHWNKAKKSGAFKYDLNLLFKTLQGKFSLTCELNCERRKYRRKPHHFRSIKDEFDSRRFNYAKINENEVLMQICNAEEDIKSNSEKSDSYIIINNSPISVGHSLLVPHRFSSTPQVLTLKSVKLASELMLMSGCRFFHIVFNSILALASVNHLHLHLYYWPYSTKIITRPTVHLVDKIYIIKDWILPGFVVQLNEKSVESFVKPVYKVIRYLTEAAVPHNMFMARAPKLVAEGDKSQPRDQNPESDLLYVTCYIFPRKPMYGTKPITNMAAASCELGGHILVYSTWAFQEMTEEKVLRIFDAEAKLEPGEFEKHCDNLKAFN